MSDILKIFDQSYSVDPEYLATKLQTFLSGLTKEGEKLLTLDYKNPVLPVESMPLAGESSIRSTSVSSPSLHFYFVSQTVIAAGFTVAATKEVWHYFLRKYRTDLLTDFLEIPN